VTVKRNIDEIKFTLRQFVIKLLNSFAIMRAWTYQARPLFWSKTSNLRNASYASPL